MKVELLDSTDRRRVAAITAIDASLGVELAWRSRELCRRDLRCAVWDAGGQVALSAVFVHINDLVAVPDRVHPLFAEVASDPRACAVVYSGGEIVETSIDGVPHLSQNDRRWRFDVQGRERFLVVPGGVASTIGVDGREALTGLKLSEGIKVLADACDFQKFFKALLPASSDLLGALSILCQGYVAVHFDVAIDDSRKATTLLLTASALNDAAVAMGWANFFASNFEYLPAALRDQRLVVGLREAVVETHRSSYSNSAYWNVFGGDVTNVKNSIAAEWGDALPSSIAALIDAIFGGGEVQPHIVNNAYVTLHGRFL